MRRVRHVGVATGERRWSENGTYDENETRLSLIVIRHVGKSVCIGAYGTSDIKKESE